MHRSSLYLLVSHLRREWVSYKPPADESTWLNAAVKLNSFLVSIREEEPDAHVGPLLHGLEQSLLAMSQAFDDVSTPMPETTWAEVDAAFAEYLKQSGK